MKRRKLIRHIDAAATAIGLTPSYMEGKAHTKVTVGDRRSVIPRHREINELTARAILRQLDLERRQPS